MAIIKVRGLGKVNCANERARAIKYDYERGTLPDKVQIGDMVTVPGEDIKGIVLEADEIKTNSVVSENADRQYWDHRKRTLNLSAVDRAKNLGLFRLFWWAMTGERSEGKAIEVEAWKIQKSFFEQNPKRMYCEPVLWRPLVNQEAHPPSWNGNAIHLIELCVMEDKKYTRA